MARKIAKHIVKLRYADRCEVQLAYAIGVAEPVSIAVDCFGTEKIALKAIEEMIRTDYDLTPAGIISFLKLLEIDYNEVSSYGHFGKEHLPWEQ